MAKLSLHRVDPTDSQSGKWFTFVGPIRFKLGRVGTAQYREFVALNAAKYKDDFPQLLNRAISEAVIFDWEGIDDETVEPCVIVPEGEDESLWFQNSEDLWEKQLPYSPEAAYELMTNPEYELVHQWIDLTSTTIENFRVDSAEKGSST